MFRQVLTLTLCFCLGFTTAFAQIQHGGTPYSFGKQSVAQRVPDAVVPAPDVNALLAEDASESSKGLPYRFGQDIEVNYNLDNSGLWETLKNGDRLWRLQISSAGATSLNFIFSHFYMPEGATMFIYTSDKQYLLGAFNSSNNKEHGKFSTTVLPGSSVIIEYFEPAAVAGRGRLAVSKVIYGYKNTFFSHGDKANGSARDFGDAGSCNNNVACPVAAGWENEINASLLYMLGNNTRICSGSMLNNVRADGTPYFLSANHCYSSDYATWIFMFNYESPQCTPTTDGPTNQTVSGCSLKAKWGTSDFMLFELSSQPPANYNVYYAGWSNVNSPGTSAVGIHHPAGDVKKISFENDPYVSSGYFGAGNDHWKVPDWDDGTTEGGSSGSPLFNQDHRVVGQLHGGNAACGNNQEDYYGRFALSWTGGGSTSTRLKDWLDPDNTGATVLDGASFTTPAYTVDAYVQSINNIPASSCNTNVDPTVRVVNYGATVITALKLLYRVDSGTWDTLSWNGGSLNYTQSTIITVPTLSLGAGQHNFEVQLLSINNGAVDQNAANNTLSQSFAIIVGTDVLVDLTTDDYGSETTLYIQDDNQNTVWQQGGFSDNTSYNLSVCLADGCYSFIITDDAGDGICCFYGNGSYEVILPGNVSAGSGGQFNDNETVPFCLNGSGVTAPVANFSADVTNACLGDTIEFNDLSQNDPTSWSWSFPGGTPSSSSEQNPKVVYNTAGTYNVSLTAGNAGGSNATTQSSLMHVSQGPDITVSITDESSPGAHDGSVQITTNSGGPYDFLWNDGSTIESRGSLVAGDYRISVSIPGGCTSVVKAHVGGSVGVDDVLTAAAVNVYPVPANSELFVEVSVSTYDDLNLSLTNLLGQQLISTTIEQDVTSIPVDRLEPGIYLLQINSKQGRVIRKIVVE